MWSKECYQNSLVQLMTAEAQEESDNNLGCILGESKLCVELNRREQNGKARMLGRELESPAYRGAVMVCVQIGKTTETNYSMLFSDYTGAVISNCRVAPPSFKACFTVLLIIWYRCWKLPPTGQVQPTVCFSMTHELNPFKELLFKFLHKIFNFATWTTKSKIFTI